MTEEEFFEEVRAMRHNQKRFIISGNPKMLELANEHAAKVDAYIRDKRERQLKIFQK